MTSLPGSGHGRGIALMVAAMVVFASQDGITKHLATQFAVPQILWIRYVFFLLLALWLTRAEGPRRTFRSAVPGTQILRALLLVAEIGLFVLAVRHLPLAGTHAILATTPLIATALSVPLLGERVGPRRWAAVGVGFLGMLIILRPGIGVFQPAMLLPLAAAVLFALYQILTRRVSGLDPGGTTLAYTAAAGAVVFTVLGPFHWEAPDAAGWAFLLTLAVTGATGHLLLIKALSSAPAAVLQPFNYLLLVWATLIGWVFFDDLPDAATVIGAMVVVASGLYTLYREQRVRSS